MKYNDLGKSDIKVSRICLGTMTWGQQNTEAEAHEQLDYAVSAGVNFIDTAEVYPVPLRAETQGLTETYIGNWLKKRNDRDQLIIASKVAAQQDWLPYLRNGQACLDKKNIEQALNESLTRLKTDYIDLYQTHWPDRHANFFGRLSYHHTPEQDGTAIAETLAVLNEFVKAGKIRTIGISNETPWGCAEYLRIAKEQGLARIVSIQNPYNLLNRSFEIGLAEFAHREHVGLLAYSPLSFGVLSGKYLNGAKPEGARLSLPLFKSFNRYNNPQSAAATEAYVKLAQDYRLDPAQMALAYVNSRPFLTGNIIGATTMAQLKSNIASIDVELPAELVKKIDAIQQQNPNPAP